MNRTIAMSAVAASLLSGAVPAPASAEESWFSGTPAAPCARYNGKLTPVNKGTWITADDYPAAALREGRGGQVVYQVRVNKLGRATKVTIVSASWPDLGAATSRALLRRARFLPAMRRCTPLVSTYSSSITWIVPDE